MRPTPWLEVERYRIDMPTDNDLPVNHPYRSEYGDAFGRFLIPYRSNTLQVIAIADYDGWDHVSVSLPNRCPNWNEMCHVKDLFWWPEEAAMQLHPPRSDYRNFHPYCLHLWRPTGTEIPLPPGFMVGPLRREEAGEEKP